MVKFIIRCFIYFCDELCFMIKKYRNILLWVCIIIYLVYKKDVLCNIKRLFFLRIDLTKLHLNSLKYKKYIVLVDKS